MVRRVSGEQKERHRIWEEGGDLDPEQVQQSREEKMSYMVKTLGMFDLGSWEEATSKAAKASATTKWIDRMKKNDDGRRRWRRREQRLQTLEGSARRDERQGHEV